MKEVSKKGCMFACKSFKIEWLCKKGDKLK